MTDTCTGAVHKAPEDGGSCPCGLVTKVVHRTPAKAGAPGTAGAGYRDLVHVTVEDVSETRRPNPEQARAIALLELNPAGHPSPRLSLAQWRHVDRVVRTLGSLGIPAPRPAPEDPPC